jgi:hypothetical protein
MGGLLIMKRTIIILAVICFLQTVSYAGNPYKTALRYIDTCIEAKTYLLGSKDSVYKYYIWDSIYTSPQSLNFKNYINFKYAVPIDSIKRIKQKDLFAIYKEDFSKLINSVIIYRTEEVKELVQSLDTANYNVKIRFSEIEKANNGIIISVDLRKKIEYIYNEIEKAYGASPPIGANFLFLISEDCEKVLDVVYGCIKY